MMGTRDETKMNWKWMTFYDLNDYNNCASALMLSKYIYRKGEVWIYEFHVFVHLLGLSLLNDVHGRKHWMNVCRLRVRM